MCFPRFLIDRVEWSNLVHRLIRWLPRPVCVFHLWAWSADGTVDFSKSPSFVQRHVFHLWAWSADGPTRGLLQESVVCTMTPVPPVGMEF